MYEQVKNVRKIDLLNMQFHSMMMRETGQEKKLIYVSALLIVAILFLWLVNLCVFWKRSGMQVIKGDECQPYYPLWYSLDVILPINLAFA